MKIIEGLNKIGNIYETQIWFDMTYNTTISKIFFSICKVTFLLKLIFYIILI